MLVFFGLAIRGWIVTEVWPDDSHVVDNGRVVVERGEGAKCNSFEEEELVALEAN